LQAFKILTVPLENWIRTLVSFGMFVLYFPLTKENAGDYTTGGGVYKVRVMVLVLEESLKIIKELLENAMYFTLFERAVKYTESVSLLQYLLVVIIFPTTRLLSVYAFIDAWAKLHPFTKLTVVPLIRIRALGLSFKLVEYKPSKFTLIFTGGVVEELFELVFGADVFDETLLFVVVFDEVLLVDVAFDEVVWFIEEGMFWVEFVDDDEEFDKLFDEVFETWLDVFEDKFKELELFTVDEFEELDDEVAVFETEEEEEFVELLAVVFVFWVDGAPNTIVVMFFESLKTITALFDSEI
jgi:hypothetical protein